MNKQVLNQCVKGANKIVNILEGMEYTTPKRFVEGELNALITFEIRNVVNDVVTDFYKNAALVPVEPEEEFP